MQGETRGKPARTGITTGEPESCNRWRRGTDYISKQGQIPGNLPQFWKRNILPVRTNDGDEYRRNRRFLMKTPSESFKQPDTFKVQEQRNVEEETQVADEHAGTGEAAPSTSTETTWKARIQKAADLSH